VANTRKKATRNGKDEKRETEGIQDLLSYRLAQEVIKGMARQILRAATWDSWESLLSWEIRNACRDAVRLGGKYSVGDCGML